MMNMIKLTDSEKQFIRENFDNPDALIETDDVNKLLDVLDDLIMDKGHDLNQDITDLGRSYEKIYDHIYDNN